MSRHKLEGIAPHRLPEGLEKSQERIQLLSCIAPWIAHARCTGSSRIPTLLASQHRNRLNWDLGAVNLQPTILRQVSGSIFVWTSIHIAYSKAPCAISWDRLSFFESPFLRPILGILKKVWENYEGILKDPWGISTRILRELWGISKGIVRELWRNSKGFLREL